MNMIKLMIKCRLLPLNVDSFFDLKLESCGSVMISTLQGKGTLKSSWCTCTARIHMQKK